MINAAIARIVLRYGAAALMTYGYVKTDFGSDPDALLVGEIVLGGLIGAGTEVWYWAAKRLGWST